MTFKIAGSRFFRSYTDKSKEKIYLENNQNRNVFEIRLENWEEFYSMVQTVDRHIKKKIKKVGE